MFTEIVTDTRILFLITFAITIVASIAVAVYKLNY